MNLIASAVYALVVAGITKCLYKLKKRVRYWSYDIWEVDKRKLYKSQIASFNVCKKAQKVAFVDADLLKSWKIINEEDIG